MKSRYYVLFVLAFVLNVARAGTIPYTVGGDGGCDFTSIQGALDAAAVDSFSSTEVHIARNAIHTQIALDIIAENTTLVGGFDTCLDRTPSGRVVLDGSGGVADSVITIGGSATDVSLQNLSITGGDPGAGNFGGGIQIIGARSLQLVNTTISNNSSQRGGGVYFDGGGSGTLNMDANSLIFSNHADIEGGGVFCKGASALTSGDIFANTASNGAGLFADSCDFKHNATLAGDGLFLNDASNSGGGAYLLNSSALRVSGIDDGRAVISLNSAVADGGGVYVADAGSLLSLESTSLRDNSAGGRGGGLFMSDGTAVFDRGELCSLEQCSQIADNVANGEGGGIYMLSGGLFVYRTYAFDNSSPDGSLIKSEGGTAYFEGIIGFGNRDATAVMRLKNSANTLLHSTLTQNLDQANTLLLTGGSLSLRGSILWEDSSGVLDFFGATTTQTYECLLVSSFPFLVMQTDIIFDPPQFVDSAAEDFHLRTTSPAVDFCWNLSLPPIAERKIIMETGGIDIDGTLRGEDLPGVADRFGPFDLGADELLESVFKDGFETPMIW